FDKKFIYLETETNVKEGEKVTNLGFPSKNAKNIIVIDTKNGLSIKKVEKQEGTIFKIKTNFLCEEKNQKSKVRIQKAIVTNYSTEKGFSGGPLLNEQGKVIGMVSRRYADALKSMVSISINEIAMLPHPFS
ncbi:trypsin-like peptidase domain-containing protein, partial [bacterium]|nr:trypsin-like peptidase domain-containing protein [bacterium]